jgi:SSS family solute:Na+ symporter
MTSLGLLDWLIFGGYVVVVFALGLWFAREQHTNEDYFVGGRRMNWIAVGLSLFAGTFSSLSFVGLPREAAYKDYHLYLAILFIPFAAGPLLWFVFVPLYYRLRLISINEYFERRFNSRVRKLGSFLFASYAIGWMGDMLHAVGVILQTVLNLSRAQLTLAVVVLGLFATLYTSLGGVKAVIWTDVLQAITLGGGMLLVLFLVVGRVPDGWSTVWQVAVRDQKFAMLNTRFDMTENENVYSVVAFGIFVYVGAHLVSFGAVQRYVSMPNLRAARGSLIVNGFMVAAVCGLFFLVGTALYGFYHHPEADGFPASISEDQLLPYFIQNVLALPGLNGLLLAGLFAAAMSSVDTGINSLTATLVYDWLDGRHHGVGFSRIMCAVFGMAVIISALVVPLLGDHVFEIIMKISGTFIGPLFGMLLLGVLIPWSNPSGVLCGLIAAAACLMIVWGVEAWQGIEISHWWYGAFTCVPTFVVGVLASRLFPRPQREQIEGLVFGHNSEGSQPGFAKV